MTVIIESGHTSTIVFKTIARVESLALKVLMVSFLIYLSPRRLCIATQQNYYNIFIDNVKSF